MKKFIGVTLAGVIVVILLSPVWVLGLPGLWKWHVYHIMSFRLIAKNELAAFDTPEETVEGAIDYVREHLWVFIDSVPYSGKPFDYLVEGVGWCDYEAKVLGKLLAARGISARYAFLIDRDGISPHTVAEVYLHGNWRAVDPLFNLIYTKEDGEWATLEEATPELISQLPDMQVLNRVDPETHDHVLELARRTYPLPQPPQRSDDFLAEQHLFDWLATAYVDLFGAPFANWYQDAILWEQGLTSRDPIERQWHRARNYHLYHRLAQAEPLYRQILVEPSARRYRERAFLFLGELLIRQSRFQEAREVFEVFQQEAPMTDWVYFQLAVCYGGIGDRAQELSMIQKYQQRVHGGKFSLEAAERAAHLQQMISALD